MEGRQSRSKILCFETTKLLGFNESKGPHVGGSSFFKKRSRSDPVSGESERKKREVLSGEDCESGVGMEILLSS